jgi:hypothetical protein
LTVRPSFQPEQVGLVERDGYSPFCHLKTISYISTTTSGMGRLRCVGELQYSRGAPPQRGTPWNRALSFGGSQRSSHSRVSRVAAAARQPVPRQPRPRLPHRPIRSRPRGSPWENSSARPSNHHCSEPCNTAASRAASSTT